MRTHHLLALFLVAAPLAATPLAAQNPLQPPAGAELVDRVVAVVGDTVILSSDVQGALIQYAQSGRPIPSDPIAREALAKQILEQSINNVVLVEAARAAGMTLDEDQVKQEVEARIKNIESKYPSPAAFDQALAANGRTRAEYMLYVEGIVRDEMLGRKLIGEKMRDRARPVISEDQLREAFEQHKGELGERPATVSLQQVIIEPQPTDSATAKALATAQEVLKELANGGDFAVLAKRFSDDPGTKEQGGELGWVRQDGHLVKPFEDAVFSLRPGQTSPLIKTDFGYHIIQVEKVRGPERQVRHILIAPEYTDADLQRAKERADSVAAAIRSGASAAELGEKYGTRPEEARVDHAPIGQLPPDYAPALKGVKQGDVVGPVKLPGPHGGRWVVSKVTGQQDAGEYTLDDVRDQLTFNLQQQAMMEDLVADLRRSMFVKVLM
ncbi:MAG TPA: peptidylprolyl isomerase [Longimicrobiaceae bacterium]|nr:peptidylprolyl isomerase [Longimicrobiaceae bacterium]